MNDDNNCHHLSLRQGKAALVKFLPVLSLLQAEKHFVCIRENMTTRKKFHLVKKRKACAADGFGRRNRDCRRYREIPPRGSVLA